MYKKNPSALALVVSGLSVFAAACGQPIDQSFRQEIPPAELIAQGVECESFEDPASRFPHVRARTEVEAQMCFGYFHARDRGWQMDFFRRSFLGARSEAYGYREVETDLKMRMLGLLPHAQRMYRELSPETKRLLWAYAIGVNAGFRKHWGENYAARKFNLPPWDWHPIDTIGILLLQSLDQTRQTFERDILEQDRIDRYGTISDALFSSDGLPWTTSILKPGEYAARSGSASVRPVTPTDPSAATERSYLRNAFAQLRGLDLGMPEDAGTGSNNWAVAKSRSGSGTAWFANDPHLELRNPPFWYWIHIENPAWEVMGATVPGVPFVASGVTRTMAWGLTNAYVDVADAILVPENATTRFRSERPRVDVRVLGLNIPLGVKFFERTEDDGYPVIPIDSPEGHRYVLRWTGYHMQGKDLDAFAQILRARNVQEMDSAVANLKIPAWNLVFADTQGEIGHRVTGRMIPKLNPQPYGPIRVGAAGIPKTTEFLSDQEQPHVLKPARGFVVTANNRQWLQDSKYFDTRSSYEGWRAFRIEELIRATPKFSAADHARIQCDIQAVDARFIVPEMVRKISEIGQKRKLSPLQQEALEALRAWNFQTDLDCKACAVHRRIMDRLKDALLMNEIAVFRALKAAPKVPGFESGLWSAFIKAVVDVSHKNSGKLPTWGQIHQLPFWHFLERQFPNPEWLASTGDTHSVNPGATRWEPSGVLRNYLGASQRLIVEMTQPPKVRRILAGENRDYRRPDLKNPALAWQKWLNCEYEEPLFPVQWSTVKTEKIPLQVR